MRTKNITILITAFSLMTITGCKSEAYEVEEPTNEVEKEIYTQESVGSMLSEENLKDAKEQVENRGGPDYIAPDFSDIEENEAEIIKLNESNIANGRNTTFENHNEYTEVPAEELGMTPGYFSKHYKMIWTTGVPTYGFEELSNGTTIFNIKKYSSLIECHFQSIDSNLNEKIIKNIRYAYENDIPITVYGEFEEFIDEEGYPDYRLVVHQMIFNEVTD